MRAVVLWSKRHDVMCLARKAGSWAWKSCHHCIIISALNVLHSRAPSLLMVSMREMGEHSFSGRRPTSTSIPGGYSTTLYLLAEHLDCGLIGVTSM